MIAIIQWGRRRRGEDMGRGSRAESRKGKVRVGVVIEAGTLGGVFKSCIV